MALPCRSGRCELKPYKLTESHTYHERKPPRFASFSGGVRGWGLGSQNLFGEPLSQSKGVSLGRMMRAFPTQHVRATPLA